MRTWVAPLPMHDDPLVRQSCRTCLKGIENSKQRTVDDEEFRLAVGQDIAELRGRVAHIDGDHHGAEPRQREPGHRKRRYVRHHHGDMRPFADADPAQRAGEPGHAIEYIMARQRLVAVEEHPGHRSGIGFAKTLHQIAEIGIEGLGLHRRTPGLMRGPRCRLACFRGLRFQHVFAASALWPDAAKDLSLAANGLAIRPLLMMGWRKSKQ